MFKQSGYALLEVVIVLFLITLIVGLSSFFVVDSMPGANLDAAAREVSATIRRARVLAMLNSEERRIIMDLDAKNYGMEGFGFKRIPGNVGMMALDPLHGEVKNGKYEIRFTANGSIVGGDLVLWNSKRTITVRPDPVLGSVTLR